MSFITSHSSCPVIILRLDPTYLLQPEVDETVHLVSLAADFQLYDFRAFSATYNPDDLREFALCRVLF